MLSHLLKVLGFADRDDLIEFLVTGLSTLPIMLMLGGWLAEAGVAMITMIILLAGSAAVFPPPDIMAEDDESNEP